MTESSDLSIELKLELVIALRTLELLLLVFSNVGNLDSATELAEDRFLLLVDDFAELCSARFDRFEVGRELWIGSRQSISTRGEETTHRRNLSRELLDACIMHLDLSLHRRNSTHRRALQISTQHFAHARNRRDSPNHLEAASIPTRVE